MRKRSVVSAGMMPVLALTFACLLATGITAQKGPTTVSGAPLKGVDVKLGKNPGGGAAARTTTDRDGKFNLGVVPAGSYILILEKPMSTENSAPVKPIVVSIKGAVGGQVKTGWNFETSKAFDLNPDPTAKAKAPEKIILESDGHNPLTGICETAVVRAKSNISNN
jgi:hypothetical protein